MWLEQPEVFTIDGLKPPLLRVFSGRIAIHLKKKKKKKTETKEQKGWAEPPEMKEPGGWAEPEETKEQKGWAKPVEVEGARRLGGTRGRARELVQNL